MKSNFDQGTLTLYLTGRFDAHNASAVEADMLDCCNAQPPRQLVLDLEELQYISSAGLRSVLRLRSLYPGLRLIGASTEVYDIFDMTGFTEIMPVEKAYRRLSVDGCEMIGRGANGKVFRLNEDTIIKVYLNPDSLPDIQRERELARKAFILGIPTAIPYDVVKVGSGYGSVFELLNAKSFIQLIQEDRSRFDEAVRLSVELLKKIHSTRVKPGDMPDQHEVVLGWAEFARGHIPHHAAEKLIAMIRALPPCHTMLHGDFHMKNIMMQGDETLLIDMDTLSLGHPIFEFAQIYGAYVGFGEVDETKLLRFMGLNASDCRAIWEKTLSLYFDGDEAACRTVTEKARLLAYLRILRRTIRRNGDPALIAHCKRNLIALIDRVETLSF